MVLTGLNGIDWCGVVILQPVGFVSFGSREDADSARHELQVCFAFLNLL